MRQVGESNEEYYDRTGFVSTVFDVGPSIEFLTMDGYEAIALKNAVYPNIGSHQLYPALGLAEEVGEFIGKLKKLMRNGDDVERIEPELAKKLAHELGDILWYLTASAFELGFTLEEIAQLNIEKCLGRRARGTIHRNADGTGLGEGDDR